MGLGKSVYLVRAGSKKWGEVTKFRIAFLEAQGLTDLAYDFADALHIDDMVELLIATKSLVMVGLERERGHSANRADLNQLSSTFKGNSFGRAFVLSCFRRRRSTGD